MELNDIITLAAASLLSGKIEAWDGVLTPGTRHAKGPSGAEITQAVRTAKQIWKKVQQRDNEY